jgi:hypothetical protein
MPMHTIATGELEVVDAPAGAAASEADMLGGLWLLSLVYSLMFGESSAFKL